jgi:hypothetical protein
VDRDSMRILSRRIRIKIIDLPKKKRRKVLFLEIDNYSYLIEYIV